ncbi:membrane protein [Albidovulum inexpectatum]|uniref:Membrane protein n=1 Tax=Albidovulum inexpectatum TaxID=196587 RepID=A0A2S5JI28_9RHOB|nr:YihY/virulence factor BrkB family protein [Albidovulum inexpectatum]PPB81177.1 membrane protein [Albidovulum inexpectatum]
MSRPREIWAFTRAVIDTMSAKRIPLIASGVAFHAMFALFPALTALITLWGIFADPAIVRAQIEAFDAVMPPDIRNLVTDQLTSIAASRPQTLGWAGLASVLLSIWSARAGTAALIQGLNAIHEVPDRSMLNHYRATIGLTAALVAIAIVVLAAVVALPVVLAFLPLGPLAEIVLQTLRWVVLAAIMIGGAGIVYRIGPNRDDQDMSWLSPGAIIAVLAWLVVSAAFSIYLGRFGSYNQTYGTLGAVIALMMWLYLSALLLLLGAAINMQIRANRRTGAGTPTTTGKEIQT